MSGAVLSLDPRLAAHLAVALRHHQRQLRGQGLFPPPGFEELLAWATEQARPGQEATSVDALAEVTEPRAVDAKFLTRDETAEGLGVSVRTVDRLIRQGDLPSVHLRSRRLVPRDAFEAYVAALRDREAEVLAG